jgi:hypothetical protein
MMTARAANAKAIYFMTNDSAGSPIIAMKVEADGTLSHSSLTSTGG